MQNERLTQLFLMEKTDSQDPMTKYMIALELKKNADLRCEDYFSTLLVDFPEYMATYYIAGEYFYNKEEYERSAEILRKGLEIAQKQENQKAYTEIKNLLFNVEMEF